MSAAEALEGPRRLRRPGDTDAATYSWADVESGLYGLVRVATGMSADGAELPSALAVTFAGRETVGAIALAGAEAADAAVATVDEPLGAWTLRGGGETGFELRFTACTPPAELGGREKAVKAGGLEGYEQLCTVSGTMRVGGRERSVQGLGQRGRMWGNPDWDRIALTRSIGVWLDDDSGVVLSSIRPAKVSAHAGEATWAAALDSGQARAVDDPRVSTTTDGEGRQIRAGLELWLDRHDDYPFRGTGEVVTGSTLELGALRLDVAFFRWHVEGRTAVGRYDVIRRAA